MSKMKFNKEYLNFVQSLSTISESIIFKKAIETNVGFISKTEAEAIEDIKIIDDKEKIFISSENDSSTIKYFLFAKPENFEFDSEEIAFYNFNEFYNLLQVFTTPDIEQKENKITISEGKTKIKYLLSDAEVLKRGPKKLLIKDKSDVKFVLTKEQLKELKKIISLLGSAKCQFEISKDKLICKLFNDSHDNSFEKEYEIKEKNTDELSMIISSEIFTLIPDLDYTIEIISEGLIIVKYQNKEFAIRFFVAEKE